MRYAKPFVHTVKEGCESGDFTTRNLPEEIVDQLLSTLAGAMFPRLLKFPGRSNKRFRAVLLEQLAAALGVGSDRSH